MFESKSPVLRIGAYIIIGFFTLIIIISFGMPDFMSRLTNGENLAATVNGEIITRMDYLRYRDSMARQVQNVEKKEIQEMILNNLISRRLMLQKADEAGIKVSEVRVMDIIKSFFRDDKGKFNKVYMDRYLTQYHMGLSDFMKMIREDLIIDKFREMISVGAGVSPDEINSGYLMDNSRIQVKYSFISSAEISKKYQDKIKVSDKEIDDELSAGKEELKDPVSDRARIKEKIEREKLNKIKNEIISGINKLAEEKKSFNEAASYLGGAVSLSNVFKIGEAVKEGSDKGKVLYSLFNADIFQNSLLSLSAGTTSRVIDSFDGLYIFTPVKREIAKRELPSAEYEKYESNFVTQRGNSIFMTVMNSVYEKSKITRNIKFD